MLKNMVPNVLEWLSEPREFHTKAGTGEPGLAREILFALWEAYPGLYTSDENMALRQLGEIAKGAGFEDVHRMIGGSICEANGGRSITLDLKP